MNFIDKYLDQDSVNCTQFIHNEKWDNPDKSNREIEKQ